MSQHLCQTEIEVVRNATALARAAGDIIVAQAREAVEQRGRFMLALSGGSTPRRLYRMLATDPGYVNELPWRDTHLFFGDERCVPPTHAESNYRMAAEALSGQIPAARFHRIRAEGNDPERVAREYEERMADLFAVSPPDWPRFDLVLLGLGPDAHTASLFPHTAALEEGARWMLANPVPQEGTVRFTLTPPVLNHAALVVFLVSGADKAQAVHAVLRGPRDPRAHPAQLVRPIDGRLIWLIDRDAAARL